MLKCISTAQVRTKSAPCFGPPVNFRRKWLVWNVKVHFDYVGLQKVCAGWPVDSGTILVNHWRHLPILPNFVHIRWDLTLPFPCYHRSTKSVFQVTPTCWLNLNMFDGKLFQKMHVLTWYPSYLLVCVVSKFKWTQYHIGHLSHAPALGSAEQTDQGVVFARVPLASCHHGRARLEPTCGGKGPETSNFNIGGINFINSRNGAVFMHVALQGLRHLKISSNKRVKRNWPMEICN